MKTEMDDLKIRIKGNDCNCERLIGLINNNTLDILNLTSSIDTVKLDVLDVQKNVNMENGNRGTFTAPVSGFYSFSFSAQGDTLAPYILIS